MLLFHRTPPPLTLVLASGTERGFCFESKKRFRASWPLCLKQNYNVLSSISTPRISSSRGTLRHHQPPLSFAVEFLVFSVIFYDFQIAWLDIIMPSNCPHLYYQDLPLFFEIDLIALLKSFGKSSVILLNMKFKYFKLILKWKCEIGWFLFPGEKLP